MTLRAQFLVGVAILVVVLFVMGAFSLYTARDVQEHRDQQAMASMLERQANDLSYISNNYLLYHEPSQVAQWESTFSSFQGNLARLQLDETDEVALVTSIKANAGRAQGVFEQIVSAVQAAGSTGVVAEPAFLQLSWSRVEVQNRQIVFEASRLGRLLARHADSAGLRSNIALFSLVAGFGLLILAGYVFMYRRTLAGILALKAGAEIVGTGDLDHRIPEDRRDELGDLSRAFNKMTTDLKSVGGMYLSQLHIASALQQSLLDVPEQTQEIDFGHLYRSATLEASVGGDFYDVFKVDDRRVALLMGDVSGHGVEAARIATLVKDVVYAYSQRSSVPGDVVASTNELLVRKHIPGFVTMFLAVLDLDTGLLTYCSAGHPNALVVDSDGHLRLLEAASPRSESFREGLGRTLRFC